jgi:hypothetical protein
MSAAENERSMVTTRGTVVIHFSRLGGRLDPHQKVMLDADAKVIALVLGYDFGGRHQAAKDYAAPVFFVPDDTLLVDEASSLGIRGPNDFYGGVVPQSRSSGGAVVHFEGDAPHQADPLIRYTMVTRRK